MSIGQEGDTRPYGRLKRNDYYEAKKAVQHLKRQPTRWTRCKTCGQEIRGQKFGIPGGSQYDLRCWNERNDL